MPYHPVPWRVRRLHTRLAASILCLVLGALIAGTAYAQASIRYVNVGVNDGLIAMWDFDEGNGGVVLDVSRLPQNKNPGVLVGSVDLRQDDKPLRHNGLNQSTLFFDGGDGKVVIADNGGQLNLVTAFTVAGWVKRAADDGAGVFFSSGANAGAWYVGFAQDGRAILGANGQTLAGSTSALPINQWVYLFVAKDSSGSVRFYFDGADAGGGQVASLTTPSGEKTIGSRPGDAGATWQGRVDLLSIYNRALSAAEIARLNGGYVCATDGLSWATAYRDLHCALQEAPSSSEIWIARGMYVPGTLGDHAYQMRNTVDLYGGFAGTETSRDQRPAFAAPPSINFDPAQYTVLSADVNGDDVRATFDNYGDNNNRVVKGDGAVLPTLLDGLLITGGNADVANQENAVGGGLVNGSLFNPGGNLSLSNIAFVANYATTGGALAHYNAGLRLVNVTFLGNRAANTGGAVFAQGGSMTLNEVRFDQNQAQNGGALAADNTTITLSRSSFTNNKADQRGGGALLLSVSDGRLTDVAFTGNQAAEGGGLAAAGSSAVLSKVTWSGNTATNGGGLYSADSGLQLGTSLFTGNQATLAGGMYWRGGSVALTEVTFTGNRSTQNAGGLYLEGSGAATANRIQFYANVSGDSGGGVWSANATDVSLFNAVFAGNRAVRGAAAGAQGSVVKLSNVTAAGNTSTSGATFSLGGSSSGWVRNTLVWGNSAAQAVEAAPGVGVQSNHLEGAAGDPRYVRAPSPGDGSWDTLDNNDYGDLSVQQGSPVVDAGDNSALPPAITTDIKGSTRYWDDPQKADTGIGSAPLVDIGAHEYINALPVAVANGPYSSVEGTPVTVSAQGSSTPAGQIVQYAWDCRDDGHFELTGQAATGVCTYEDDGTYTVRLRVTAAVGGVQGGTADATALVYIANAVPVYTSPGSQLALPNVERTFDLGSFVDAGVLDTWKVSIDWGDGAQEDFPATEQGPLRATAHTYAQIGQYPVRVSVRDDDGGVITGAFNVTVNTEGADSDGDGVPDLVECSTQGRCADSDNDGIPDYLDADDDNDGIPSAVEANRDTDGDGIPDARDPDDDNDSLPTATEGANDRDGDGVPDYLDPDDDGDGRPTLVEHGRDDNLNGVPDEHEAGSIVMLALVRK